jgi:molybdopterin-guanine dinucleotide biosynthesis protein A
MNKWYNIAPLRVIPANKDFPDAYIQLVDVYLEESITTSIKQNNSKLINNIYPNPSTDFINIQLENGIFNAQYKILDINGKTMLQQTISGLQKNITVDISMLEKGNYIMSIENEKRIDTHKFTKH